MLTGNAELRCECSPVHLCMGTVYDWNKTRKIVRMKADRVKMEISKAGTKEKKSWRPNCLLGVPSPCSHNYQKQWINYLTNLTYRNNAMKGRYMTNAQMRGWVRRQRTRNVGFTSGTSWEGLIYYISKASLVGYVLK